MLSRMLGRILLILVCVFLCQPVIQAEPANVLVGDLTFTRPTDWTWESPGSSTKSNVVTRFIIPSNTGNPSTTDVRFYVMQKDATETTALWRSFFPQSKEGKDISEEKKKIGQHELTYLSLSGTQLSPGSKPKPNCTFFGAIIPSGKEFVHIRLFGPRDEVEKARLPFQKMIEDALREKESE